MTLNWDAIGIGITILGAWTGLFLAALRWLLSRYFDGLEKRIGNLERENTARAREHLELRASLPLQYVQREDWIRFSAGLDAKLDTIRAEMRERRKPADGNH